MIRQVNLILLEAGEIDAAGAARLTGPRAVHALGVLKVSVGQSLRVGLVDGPRGTATVQAIDRKSVDLICALEPAVPQRPRVDLLLAVPRPKVMRRLWAQVAALGVGRIVLTNAERVERPYFDTHILTPDCYRPLLIEGLQQAQDTRMPEVSIHRRFKVLVEDDLDTLCGAGLRLVADPGGSASVGAVVRDHAAIESGCRVLLAIGPEGGWNRFELDLLAAHGFKTTSMGPRTLRTDTACLALLALTHDALRRD